MRVVAIVLLAACGGQPTSWRHRLILVSMSSSAAAYRQAVGTITMKLEVTDPDAAPQPIENQLANAALDVGVRDQVLYGDTECHPRDALTWTLTSVDGELKTPNGTPQQRPSWALEDTTSKHPTVEGHTSGPRSSNGGRRRSTTYTIDMRRNQVQIVVRAVSTKCDEDGNALVVDERPGDGGHDAGVENPDGPVESPPDGPIEVPMEGPIEPLAEPAP